MFFEPDIC